MTHAELVSALRARKLAIEVVWMGTRHGTPAYAMCREAFGAACHRLYRAEFINLGC